MRNKLLHSCLQDFLFLVILSGTDELRVDVKLVSVSLLMMWYI